MEGRRQWGQAGVQQRKSAFPRACIVSNKGVLKGAKALRVRRCRHLVAVVGYVSCIRQLLVVERAELPWPSGRSMFHQRRKAQHL